MGGVPGATIVGVTDIIIPAYREDPAVVAGVLEPIRASHHAGRIILVTDVASKGAAMAAGLARAITGRVAFFDADLTGLTTDAADRLLAATDGLVVGVVTVPSLLSGQRSLPTTLARQAGLTGAGYGAEMRINRAALRTRTPIRFVDLPGVHHLSTEEKGRSPAVHVKRWADVILGTIT